MTLYQISVQLRASSHETETGVVQNPDHDYDGSLDEKRSAASRGDAATRFTMVAVTTVAAWILLLGFGTILTAPQLAS